MQANILNWTKSKTDPNSGTGQYGSCCAEMDVWEANRSGNGGSTAVSAPGMPMSYAVAMSS